MLYTFLITIVFIAELIIAVTIIRACWKLDRIFILTNETLSEAKTGINDVSVLCRKISEQFTELAEDFKLKIKTKQEDSLLKFLEKILVGVLLWKLNFKAIRKIRRSKYYKAISKGFNLIQSMI